jgi:histidine triad (HIT) family protein
MSDDTLFDKIIRGEIPATVVFEDEDVLAFKDINPQAPVHVLIVPKKKVAGFDQLDEMSAAEAGEFMQAVAKVAEKLGLDETGYRVVFNVGKHGQQSVAYIHAHLLGGRQLSWPPG